MKKVVMLSLGALGTSILLAGCFGAKEVAPQDTEKKEELEYASAEQFEKKLDLKGDELKAYVQEIKTQRFSALQAFQAFFPAVYAKEIRTNEYKSAVENIIAQYQFVYNSANQLALSYPDDEEIAKFNEVVKIETEQIVTPMLKIYYDLGSAELLKFDEQIATISNEKVEQYTKVLADAAELLAFDDRGKAAVAREMIFNKQKELLGEITADGTLVGNTGVNNNITTDSNTNGEATVDDLLSEIQ